MPQRRADPRGDGKHGRDARHDGHVDLFAPLSRSGLDCLADGGCHGEDAWVAAGDDRDFFALGCLCQRGIGAGNLLAVVGGDFYLIWP